MERNRRTPCLFFFISRLHRLRCESVSKANCAKVSSSISSPSPKDDAEERSQHSINIAEKDGMLKDKSVCRPTLFVHSLTRVFITSPVIENTDYDCVRMFGFIEYLLLCTNSVLSMSFLRFSAAKASSLFTVNVERKRG